MLDFYLPRQSLRIAVLGVMLPIKMGVVAQTAPSFLTFPLRSCSPGSGIVESWGCLVEVGSSTERLCLVPSTVSNSTLLSMESLCNISEAGMARNKCESIRGGFFDETQSSTWTNATIANFNSTREEPAWTGFNPSGITRVGYDTLHLPDSSNDEAMYGYGFALNEKGNQSNAGMIGFGKESVFLDAVTKNNPGISKSWAIDAGSQSINASREGEVVIGGYNRARTDGSFAWTNISDMHGPRPCPLRTKITAMKLTFQDGSSQLLMSNGETTEACVEPYDNLFRMTQNMLLRFKSVTNFDQGVADVATTTGNTQTLSFTETGLLYAADKVQQWILTITLENGFTNTIPKDEFQTPFRGWNTLGERVEVPGIVNVAIFSQATDPQKEIPTLGKIFLSQVGSKTLFSSSLAV
jgi:hypothetical protein